MTRYFVIYILIIFDLSTNPEQTYPHILIHYNKGTATDLVVQIVLIAESMRLQAMMATYGIQTQTPHEV